MQVRTTRRQRAIMNFIRENGTVQVDELSEYLQVTPQTIRRDLNQLYDLELIHRIHGGAVIKDAVENLGYGARKVLMASEKEEIAKLTAENIPNSSSLFINIGTTTEGVARNLIKHKGLLVVTNNINVASTLWPYRHIEVMIAGGTIRQTDGGIVGASTEEFINNFKLDYAVIGCSAIDESGNLFDYDLREIRITQAMIRHASSTIIATDSMKLERRAPIKVASLADIDSVVTDEGISQEFVELCERNNVSVKIARTGESNADSGERAR